MSDNGFRLFRSKLTGKTGLYPHHFASWPDFEEIDPETGVTVSGVEAPAREPVTDTKVQEVPDEPAPLQIDEEAE